MYKLVIAEDDEILLEGLSKGVDWEAMGISVVASVNDGIYVFDKIRETDADLLLTDIRMSKKDGLEVLKEVHAQNPNFPVIILTAYEEVTYLKTAIQYGAVDYLMKPVNLLQLKDVMGKVKGKLEEQARYQSFQKKEILNRCIQGKNTAQEKTGFIVADGHKWSVLEVVPDCMAGEMPNAERILAECAQNSGFYNVDFESGHLLIACSGMEDFSEKKEKFLEEIHQRLWDETGSKVTLLIGKTVSSVSELKDSYGEVQKLREYQFCEEFGRIMKMKDIQKYELQTGGTNKMLLNNIVNVISLGKVEFVSESISRLKQELRKSGSSSLINMAYALSIIYEGLRNKIRELNEDEHYFQELYADVLSCKNLDIAMDCFEKAALDIARKAKEEQDTSGKTIAYKAKKYVDEQYMQPDLRISEIAREIGISPNYLSKLFLEEMGENFSDYLIAVRMKAAQKLLLYSSFTTQEIAQRIGYDNVSYFSVLFKKYTGITTRQYRKNITI